MGSVKTCNSWKTRYKIALINTFDSTSTFTFLEQQNHIARKATIHSAMKKGIYFISHLVLDIIYKAAIVNK